MKIEPTTICRPIACQIVNNKILRIFINCIINNQEKIVFIDFSGVVLDIIEKDKSYIDSAVAKRGFILLEDDFSKQKEFKFNNFKKAIMEIANDLRDEKLYI